MSLSRCVCLVLCAAATMCAAESPVVRTARNHVYQFSAVYGVKTSAYLWIPPACSQLRGLLILPQNVPEGLIAGSPVIREACTANDLGIVYSTQSFFYYDGPQERSIERLEAMLKKLADRSGYPEVATVPWLPIGESMSLGAVKHLLDHAPERCIAGITACDIAYGDNRTVPILCAQGTGSEWSQDKWDVRGVWSYPAGGYDKVCALRQAAPRWPVTVIVDHGGGHFNCSDGMVRYFAHYIDRIARLRLPSAVGQPLRPLDLAAGVQAHLPLRGRSDAGVQRQPAAADRPWYPDATLADEALALATTDLNAATRLPTVRAGDHCTVQPWSRNGVTTITVDGTGECTLEPYFAPAIPEGWSKAGTTLPTQGVPDLWWLSGMVLPLGGNRFAVELERNYRDGKYQATATLMVGAAAEPGFRPTVQPLLLTFSENTEGAEQRLDFAPVGDLPRSTGSVTLKATSSAGLPVRFFVDTGPAIIDGDTLRFTPIPAKATLPLEVTVVAWQWGNAQVRKAVVRQTFRLLP